MPTRRATAEWQGDFKRGGGKVAVESGVFDTPYNFSGRFEDGTGASATADGSHGGIGVNWYL